MKTQLMSQEWAGSSNFGSAQRVLARGIYVFGAVLLGFAAGGSQRAGAVTLAKWTFETTKPTGSGDYAAETNNLGKPTAARLGGALGIGAAPSNSTSALGGNGSVASFGSQTWNVGNYYEFTLNTTSYQNINVSFAQTGSNSGPRDFALTFSTDGGNNFTQVGDIYKLTAQTWSSGTYVSSYNRPFDLSSYASLANQTSVIFRLVDASTASISGNTVGSAGTSRVDDFTVSGDMVTTPEPATCVGGALLLGTCGWHLRRRRKLNHAD